MNEGNGDDVMAALYFFMAIAIGGIYLGHRSFSIILLFLALIGCWLMLWHHATDYLKINW